MGPKVYMAGPIKGLSYDEATDWRVEARTQLAQQGMDGFSPMRAKHFLKDSLSISTDPTFYDNVIANPTAIVTRDRYDVMSCDMMLINVQGASAVSLGTTVEIGWADAFRKPMVMVQGPSDGMCKWCIQGSHPKGEGGLCKVATSTPTPSCHCLDEPLPSPFKHEFIEALVGYKVDTIEQAVLVCRAVLFSDESTDVLARGVPFTATQNLKGQLSKDG